MSLHLDALREPANEHHLQKQVLQVVREARKPDVTVFACANAGRRSQRTGARMKAEGLMPGVADLCIMLPHGQAAWLELKTIKGRQSVEQKGFEARCIRLGHPYCLARTLDEAVVFLKMVGALR